MAIVWDDPELQERMDAVPSVEDSSGPRVCEDCGEPVPVSRGSRKRCKACRVARKARQMAERFRARYKRKPAAEVSQARREAVLKRWRKCAELNREIAGRRMRGAA